MERIDHKLGYNWHIALNKYNTANQFQTWMYLAKDAADEVPRLALLFEMERNNKLVTTHHQCSHDEGGTPVPGNHLTCAMGVECRKCPFLLALEDVSTNPADVDRIKAWTCVTHILTELGAGNSFDASEGFILTEDDKMYWEKLYASLSYNSDDEDEEATE